MKKNTKVSWTLSNRIPEQRGNGTVISDEVDGHVLVSVDSLFGEPNQGFHPVIYCAVTWLKDESTVETATNTAPEDKNAMGA